MKTIGMTRRLVCAVFVLVALFLTTRAGASAGDAFEPYSQGKLIAHLSMPGGAARQMFLRRQGKTQYLYVQRSSHPGYTVIDVTKPAHPRVVNRAPLETLTVVGSGLVVTEAPPKPATALGTTQEARGSDAVSESIQLVEVSDPAEAGTVQTFSGVASVLADDARGLIYVANRMGIWIVSSQKSLQRHHCGSSDAISNMPNCD